MADYPQVVLQARNATIAELIEQCARGELPFSGPDSLHSKIAAMGYRTTSLYEMVCAAELALAEAAPSTPAAPPPQEPTNGE